jgi:hypothetical protein
VLFTELVKVKNPPNSAAFGTRHALQKNRPKAALLFRPGATWHWQKIKNREYKRQEKA